VDRLLDLIRERLLLAHDVARYKWNHKAPISDPGREKQLLQKMVQQASAKQLDESFTRTFFEAQIEASKLLQQANFDEWKASGQGLFSEVKDLKDMRVEIDELNTVLIESLAELFNELREPATRELISKRAAVILIGAGIDERVRAVAIKPLLL
jgi:chorismate mutase